MATVTARGIAWTTATGAKSVSSFTPTAGDLIVCVAGVAGTDTAPTITDNDSGITSWTLVDSFRSYGSAVTGGLRIYVAGQACSGSAMTVTMTPGAADTGGGLAVFSVSDPAAYGASAVRSTGGQADIASGTPAPVLSNTPLTKNPCLIAVMTNTNGSANASPRTATTPDYSEAYDQGFNTPPSGLEVQFINGQETSATLTTGGAAASAFAAIGVEFNTVAVFTGAAAIAITPSVTSARIVESLRSASVTATPAITAAGTVEHVHSRSASVTLTPDVASDGEFETPSASYVSEVTADSPLAWWRLGESSTGTAQEVNNVYDGTYVTGGTFAQTGAVGDSDTAVLFDGTDDYATLTTVGSLGTNIATSTCEFWIKTTTTAGPKAVLGTRDTGTGMIFEIHLNTRDSAATVAGSTNISIRGGGAVVHRNYVTTNIYDGNWHHVVIVMQGATTLPRWWVDGTERTTVTENSGTLSARNNFDNPVALAARNNVGTIERYAAVTVDEVAFYSTQLTEARIQAHYNAAVPAGPTVYERSASITITPGVASAQQNFSVLERSASVTLTPAVASVPQRVRLRSASVTLTPAVSSVATFYSILTRSAAVAITPAIATAPQRVLMRATAVTITPAVTAAGQIEGGAVTHERSASVTLTPAVASTATFYSIIERSVSVTITPAIASAQMRVLMRQASVTLTPAVASSGAILQIWSRAVAVTITPSVSAAGFSGDIIETHLPLTVEVRDALLTVIHDEGDTSIIFDSSESTVIYDETITDVAIEGDREAAVPEHLTSVDVAEPVTTVDYDETPRTVEVA